jgi:hypothetical protein
MALNKKIRRSYNNSLEILHPETTLARIKQTSGAATRSVFSQNVLTLTPDASNKFLKIATNGVISKVYTPSDFGSISSTHTHSMGAITYVKSGLWSVTTNQPHDEHISSMVFSDSTTFVTYLNTGGSPLSVNTYISKPTGWIARGENSGNPGVYFYAIVSYVTVPLDGYLSDNTNGKAPISGNKIDKTYLPDYTKGHMVYTGGANLSAGASSANAVNINTIFTTLSTNPDEQVGTFKIVTHAGYIKADGTVNGTDFIHANVEGPVYLSVGDRIIFVSYNISPVTYFFAFLHNDFLLATLTRKGVVQLADTLATNRGLLDTGTNGLAAIDEYALQRAMRDVIYAPNLPIVQSTDLIGSTYFYSYLSPQSGEPTHTSGTAIAAMAIDANEVGIRVVLSNGKIYQFASYSPPSSHTWTYIGTMTPPAGVVGNLAVNFYDATVLYIVESLGGVKIKYTKTPLLEGDLYIH